MDCFFAISAHSSRNAALRDLAVKVDASALAITLVHTAPTLIRHARFAGVGYASSAAVMTNAADQQRPR